MAKLYFKYGAMGSSKTAQALITKFNYEERGMSVYLIKPATDTRDGVSKVSSRVKGLEADAEVFASDSDVFKRVTDIRGGKTVGETVSKIDVIIVDEAQFFTPAQIDQLREIVDIYNIPVLCFGLRTDFLTKCFPGSLRLMEIADEISEIKTMCGCGSKATVNARVTADGKIVTEGSQVMIGGNDSYIAMCHKCWIKKIKEQG